MNANIILVSLLTLSLWGCSDDSPTASKPTLDTTPHTHSTTFLPIQEWTGSRWSISGYNVSLDITWRFVSSVGLGTGLRVSGGYTINFANSTDRIVEVDMSKVRFFDSESILIAEYDLIPWDEFDIGPSGKLTRNGTFEIIVGSLEATELITKMGIFGSAGFKP